MISPTTTGFNINDSSYRMSSQAQRDTNIQEPPQAKKPRGRPRKPIVEKTNRKSKICLIPFLIKELHNNTGGIEWVDKEKGIFKLDWTHLTNGQYNNKSIEVSRNWYYANNIPTRKPYSDTYAKCMLRCAINSHKEVHRRLDLQRGSTKPHTFKVYQIIRENQQPSVDSSFSEGSNVK